MTKEDVQREIERLLQTTVELSKAVAEVRKALLRFEWLFEDAPPDLADRESGHCKTCPRNNKS